MRDVIQEAVNQVESGNPCVLATVVRTKGSTPQKAGAMLLVREDGSAVGTLGGGCVEGDIWFAAREILRNQGGPEFKDYYLNEDIAARDGLVCGGTMYFYLEPFWDTDDFADIGHELLGAYDGAEPAALATIVRSDGNTASSGRQAPPPLRRLRSRRHRNRRVGRNRPGSQLAASPPSAPTSRLTWTPTPSSSSKASPRRPPW